MDESTQILRFANTAIVLKEPLLVALALGFVVVMVLLAMWGTPSEPQPSTSTWSPPVWLVWLIRLVILLVLVGVASLLCWSQTVEIDGPARQVRQTHRMLHFTIASSSEPLSNFTAVRVLRVIDKGSKATTTTGSGFHKTASRTTYTPRYKLELLLPDIVMETAERTLVAERVPVDLPLDENLDVDKAEALASQIAHLTGWPALRRGYEWVNDTGGVAPGPGRSMRADHAAQSPITPLSAW